jgi:hypothetical protein
LGFVQHFADLFLTAPEGPHTAQTLYHQYSLFSIGSKQIPSDLLFRFRAEALRETAVQGSSEPPDSNAPSFISMQKVKHFTNNA